MSPWDRLLRSTNYMRFTPIILLAISMLLRGAQRSTPWRLWVGLALIIFSFDYKLWAQRKTP